MENVLQTEEFHSQPNSSFNSTQTEENNLCPELEANGEVPASILNIQDIPEIKKIIPENDTGLKMNTSVQLETSIRIALSEDILNSPIEEAMLKHDIGQKAEMKDVATQTCCMCLTRKYLNKEDSSTQTINFVKSELQIVPVGDENVKINEEIADKQKTSAVGIPTLSLELLPRPRRLGLSKKIRKQ